MQTLAGRYGCAGKNGGPDRITTEDGGPVLEAQRPDRFVFQWRPDKPSYFTTVEMVFKPADGGTIVQLKEYGYQDTPEGRQKMLECAVGWGKHSH